jgi:AcrR family transcriptional regulator
VLHHRHVGDHHEQRLERRRRRHERRRDETRDDILTAAREVLLERGAADLSLREIASRAGFSPGALYKYFAGKDDLISALAEKALGVLAQELESVPTGLPPDERALEIGMTYLDFARRNPEDAAVIAAHEATIHSRPPSSAHRLVEEAVIGVVREGAEAGVFKLPGPGDVECAAYGAWAFAQGLAAFQQNQASGLSDVLRRRERQLLAVYVNGLKTGWPSTV